MQKVSTTFQGTIQSIHDKIDDVGNNTTNVNNHDNQLVQQLKTNGSLLSNNDEHNHDDSVVSFFFGSNEFLGRFLSLEKIDESTYGLDKNAKPSKGNKHVDKDDGDTKI